MPNDGEWMDARGARFVGVGGRFVCGDITPMRNLFFLLLTFVSVTSCGPSYSYGTARNDSDSCSPKHNIRFWPVSEKDALTGTFWNANRLAMKRLTVESYYRVDVAINDSWLSQDCEYGVCETIIAECWNGSRGECSYMLGSGCHYSFYPEDFE